MSFNIAGVPIGSGHPCRFVAEISNNHNGDLARAKRLIVAAKDAGADFVKLQCFTPDELVALRGDGPAPEPWGSQGWTMRSLYEKAQTPHDWFPHLAGFCESLGIPWFSSVFGEESLALLERIGCPAYKIAGLDNGNEPLADEVRLTGKPIIVSGARVEEVAPWCEVPDNSWKGARARRFPALTLFCPPGYPQVARLTDMRARFDAQRCDGDVAGCDIVGPEFDGFSYHGTDPLPCVAAATLGAKIIEAHFQLDDEPSELEANVSLTASAFRRMVDEVRRMEAVLA